jgi:hypothetical protein
METNNNQEIKHISTSNWKSEQVSNLNIKFVDYDLTYIEKQKLNFESIISNAIFKEKQFTNIFNNIKNTIKELTIENNEIDTIILMMGHGFKHDRELNKIISIGLNEDLNLLEDLIDKEKINPIVGLLLKKYKLITSKQDYPESNVDSFMDALFNICGFDDARKELSIASQIPIHFIHKNQMYKCKPDISVIRSGTKDIQFLTCEDKREKNTSDEPQAQAIAQMLATYYTHYITNTTNTKQRNIYMKYKFPFMTVKGDSFVFYQVLNMTVDYLNDIIIGNIPKKQLQIIRISLSSMDTAKPLGFPFSTFRYRKIIIGLLLYFRKIVFEQSQKLLDYSKKEFRTEPKFEIGMKDDEDDDEDKHKESKKKKKNDIIQGPVKKIQHIDS